MKWCVLPWQRLRVAINVENIRMVDVLDVIPSSCHHHCRLDRHRVGCTGQAAALCCGGLELPTWPRPAIPYHEVKQKIRDAHAIQVDLASRDTHDPESSLSLSLSLSRSNSIVWPYLSSHI